jgi:thiol-disulfide isomerase/thioredoxin
VKFLFSGFKRVGFGLEANAKTAVTNRRSSLSSLEFISFRTNQFPNRKAKLASNMTVTKIRSMDDYNGLLETSKTKLVVVDFSASWCGPCRFIHPIYEKMAAENPDVLFAEVDVDEVEDVRCDSSPFHKSVPRNGSCPCRLLLLRLTLGSLCLHKRSPARRLTGRRPLRGPGHAHLSLLQERGEDRRNDGGRPNQIAATGSEAQKVVRVYLFESK